MLSLARKLTEQFTSAQKTVRYRLLALVLFPILVIMPIALLTAISWGKNYTYDQLFIKVRTDLSVSHDTFIRIQQDYLQQLAALANSYTFQLAIRNSDHTAYQKQLDELKQAAGFSFLSAHKIDLKPNSTLDHPASTQLPPSARQSKALSTALTGEPVATIEIYSAKDLASISAQMADKISLPLIETPRARPSNRITEDRGMMIRALYPIRNADQKVIAILDGGALLNNNFRFVDTIRDLVYAPGNLIEGSIGTVTVFLEDVRISTNVPLGINERALGTRVSNEVRTKVLDLGIDWIDRAFVVNDWYISSYEPIVNFEGERVGMLYAGFLEAPFRNKMWNALWVLVLMFLVLMLFSIWLAIRGARSIIIPIEGMSKVVHANQRGEWLRVGQIEVNDEIGVLAREFDSMLDLLEHRKEELQDFADQLENKVASRTAELQKKNDELSRTIALLRETRQQLVAAEKLAALGELTAGVAHEINNPTSVILGNLDIIANEYSEASNPVKEEIALAIEQVYRIKGIIDSLLQYARPSEFGGYLAHVNINELVQDSLKLVQHLRKERDFDIVLDLNASETIEINAQECQQIIVNLIVNASHALPTEKGLITIRTLNWDQQGIRLIVQDNGTGISEADQKHIFNPFYSTKDIGKGTGLGLSVSYTLIRRYGGHISVESTEGLGSTFCVWILSQPKLADDDESNAALLLDIEEQN